MQNYKLITSILPVHTGQLSHCWRRDGRKTKYDSIDNIMDRILEIRESFKAVVNEKIFGLIKKERN